MTDKLCVNVNIPSVSKSHDFIVPYTMCIEKIISLMAVTISSEYGVLNGFDKAMLVDTHDNTVLNKSCSMKQMGITSGAKLILL